VLREITERGDTACVDQWDVAQHQDAGVRSALDATDHVREHVRDPKEERALQFEVLDSLRQVQANLGASREASVVSLSSFWISVS
jgi:hypothetical protein